MDAKEPVLTLTPPQEVKQDWQPRTNFWQILTGHQKIFSQKDVEEFFPNNQLSLPPSELRFFYWEKNNKGSEVYRELQNPILVQDGKEGFSPQKVLHQSWLGVQDSLRMYVFDEEGLGALQERLTSSNIAFTPLPGDLEVIVRTKLPAIIKDEEAGEIKKGEVDGVVLFLNEKNLQTPADALFLADTIAKLHPETAKKLMSSLLFKTRIVSYNLQVWKNVLTAYETGQLSDLTPLSQLPQSLQDIFNQIKSYIEAIPSDLTTFEQGLSQRLRTTPLSDINVKNSSLPIISEDKVEKHLRRILEVASKEQENQEKLQRLLQRLEANISQTPHLVNEAYESIDPKKWLLTEVAERGQQLMLDRMAPSDAMIKVLNQKHPDKLFSNNFFNVISFFWIKFLNQKHPEKPIPKNVREWIEAMGIKEEITQVRQSLIEAENLPLTPEQEKQYQEAYQKVEERIRQIMEEQTADKQQKNLRSNQFPSHPVLARWKEIKSIINDLPKSPVTDKIKAVFEAKKELAEKQVKYTNLFLKTTIKHMPGGYDGWNKRLKGALTDLLEASSYFASLFKEPNCAGRMILLSAMLMEAQVFEENDLVTMSTYDHSFLSGFDALGVGRVIEGPRSPIHSYFGIPKEKVFQGKVGNNQEIIFQKPLNIGLLTEAGINYSTYLKSKKAKELKLYLLQQSGYIEDSLWNNLALDLKSLDFLFSQSRAASITNLFPHPFCYLLYNESFYNKAQNSLEGLEKQDPLLPFIKLNLLVMKKALEDRSNTQELKRRIEEQILKGRSEFTETYFQTMRSNLQKLLSSLANTEIPDYWKEKYGANLENATIEQMRQDLWNPDLFPKPVRIDDEGNIDWLYPS